jgi:uncharacterized membrane protein
MSELDVVAFHRDRSRAAAVLGQIRERDEPWTAQFHGAIAAYRDDAGKLIVDEAFESTKGGRTVGQGMIGSLVGLALAVLALPVTAGISGALAAGTLVAGLVGGTLVGARHGIEATWWLDDLDLDEAFVAKIRATVGQDDSAIFIWLRASEPAGLDEQFGRLGGTVLRTQLTDEQTKKVHARTS